MFAYGSLVSGPGGIPPAPKRLAEPPPNYVPPLLAPKGVAPNCIRPGPFPAELAAPNIEPEDALALPKGAPALLTEPNVGWLPNPPALDADP